MDIYQSIFESGSDAFLVVDASCRIARLNATAARMFGYERKELLGQPLELLLPAGLHPSQSERAELCGRRKDTSEFPVDISVSALEPAERQLTLCAVRDITERRQFTRRIAELAGLEETERLAGVGSWSWDMATGTVHWSRQLYRNVGIDPSRPATDFEDQSQFYTKESWPQLAAAVEQAATKGTPYRLDLELNLPEPAPRWITARGEAVFDKDNRIVGLRGTVQDITERKRMLEMLAASERRLKLALEAADLGTFEWDLKSGSLSWDSATERMFGFAPGSFEGTFQGFKRLVHPDDWPRISAAIDSARDTHGVYSEEFRVLLPDGNHAWLQGKGAFVYGVSGEPLRMIGVVLDVSERKRSEAALHKSEERLRLAVRASRVGIFDYDHAAGGLEWSPFRLVAMGWDPESPVPGPDAEGLATTLRRALDPASDGSFNLEYPVTLKDGSTRWVRVQSQTFFEGEGDSRRAVRSVGTVSDITADRASEEELKKLATLVAMSHDFIGISTLDEHVVYLNDAALHMLGLSLDQARQMTVSEFLAEAKEPAGATMLEVARREGFWRGPTWLRHFAGRHKTMVELTVFPIRDDEGAPLYVAAIARDLTESNRLQAERAKLETQLAQAQNMESIGRLAGGVAHDFNNMLTVIEGYAALLKKVLPAGPTPLKYLEEIEKAANRSKDITRSLLGFSRRQIIAPVPVDLNHLLTELIQPLGRLIGEDIELRFHQGIDLWNVVVDPSQINQILLNLVVNARDAMPSGGNLTIETSNREVSRQYASANPDAAPGPYVVIAVSDTGIGMDAETAAHIFEPFFTTKEPGKGTGLGLATVYGAVRQNGGFVNVYSEPAHGSTFRIYLPRNPAEAQDHIREDGAGKSASGSGTVLLVEDDELVREMVTAALNSIGYTPLVAKSPAEALELCAERASQVRMVLTDVVMPGMNGMELRERICAAHPGMPVLFMSGYTSSTIVKHGVLQPGVHFIQKPFSIEELARRIEETLA